MADDDLGALIRGLQWGSNFRRSSNVEDRRDEPVEDAVLPRANVKYPQPVEHQPSALASYLSDLMMPPTKLQTDLGYNDIKMPSKEEIDNFNMYINDLDQDAQNYWKNDPIGSLLQRLPKKYLTEKD